MKKLQAIEVLRHWDQKGRYVFTKHELSKLFYKDSPKTLSEGLNRLVKSKLLQRACRNVYVNLYSKNLDSHLIETIAKAMRRGEYNYVSLESMLSEYGIISQVPIDRLTVMSTGRQGIYKTPYGVIEFTHTKRSRKSILSSTYLMSGRPLRVATQQAAWRDLKRVGRNVNFVDEEEIKHAK